MPEYPAVTVYVESLLRHFRNETLEGVRLGNPFLLRSVDPPLSATSGRPLVDAFPIGKRIVMEFGEEGPVFLVLHLMIAGRLRMKKKGIKLARKTGLAAFDFPKATVVLTEQGSKRRASLHVVGSREGLAEHDRGGIDVFESSDATYLEAMRRKNHTIKRSLTDPRILSGIGNAYSDEILHAAKLSPFKQVKDMSDDELLALLSTTRETLAKWANELRGEVGEGFPDKVTAFHPKMAVHGKYKEPCPECGSKVQRIVYADNEANYCAKCQTSGRLLADRSLSRLLKDDWPKRIEDLE
jgi:formamidopyrimidine-DNA glycosylase